MRLQNKWDFFKTENPQYLAYFFRRKFKYILKSDLKAEKHKSVSNFLYFEPSLLLTGKAVFLLGNFARNAVKKINYKRVKKKYLNWIFFLCITHLIYNNIAEKKNYLRIMKSDAN